jgi:hypothetical protein
VSTDVGTKTNNLDGSKDYSHGGQPILHENSDGSDDVPKPDGSTAHTPAADTKPPSSAP